MFARQIKTKSYMVIFLQKDDYVAWANIAPVTFLCNVVWDVFGQHWVYNIPMQCCPSLIDTTLYRLYFPNKSCLLTMGQHHTGKVLAQCWPTLIETTLQIIFLCNFVLELWVNIAQVIFLCNIGTGTSKQYSIGYFLEKTCLRALGQHFTSNFQTYFDNIN